ncbi:hypothetical protein BGZ60DRAFT_430028 [Tricladium varicosporioides]|nr:hypothetical protein BGZ60DRAFT_430028 [Hymenoscyphus varicosporioides]
MELKVNTVKKVTRCRKALTSELRRISFSGTGGVEAAVGAPSTSLTFTFVAKAYELMTLRHDFSPWWLSPQPESGSSLTLSLAKDKKHFDDGGDAAADACWCRLLQALAVGQTQESDHLLMPVPQDDQLVSAGRPSLCHMRHWPWSIEMHHE